MSQEHSALGALLARVEAATGPDRELDARIAYALGWRFNGFGPDDEQSESYEPDDRDFADVFDLGGHWKQPGGRFAHISESFDPAIWPDPPEWTASLDAALSLVERVLPGWAITFQLGGPDPSASYAGIAPDWWNPEHGYGPEDEGGTSATGATPALALIAAMLKALAASTAGPIGGQSHRLDEDKLPSTESEGR